MRASQGEIDMILECEKCNKQIKNKGVMVKTGIIDKDLNLPIVKFYHKKCYGETK